MHRYLFSWLEGGGSNEKRYSELLKIPRFTYRSGFEPIPHTAISTDSGWGCCYRCCQGFLARFLISVSNSNLSLFEDRLGATLSIQNLVLGTSKIGVKPGEWAKPSQIATSVVEMLNTIGFASYVCLDCTVARSSLPKSFPMLLMISLRCGLDSLDPDFYHFIYKMLQLPESLGIVSGYLGSAYYVVGMDEPTQRVFYYDPHTVSEAVCCADHHKSFFEPPLQEMQIEQMNPSMLFAFSCGDSGSLDNVLDALTTVKDSPIQVCETIETDLIDQVLDIDDLEI